MNKITQYAEYYISNGLNPMPIQAQSKAPALPPGHTYLKEKHHDLSVFKNVSKIAVACGAVSENLCCIDFDQDHGSNVSAVFYQVMQSNIFKSIEGHCAILQTPSGGFHIVFKCTKSIDTFKIAHHDNGKVMIETRGEGGYILTYPTEGYNYIGGCNIENLEAIDYGIINQFITYLKSYSKEEKAQEKGLGKLRTEWNVNTPDGKYNEECVDEAKQILKNNGWTMSELRRDGVEYWIRPGKEEGTSATFGKFRNYFYVFTSSCLEFSENKAYTPFNIYTAYNHAGDWRKSKDALRERFKMNKIEYDEIRQIDFPIEIFPDELQQLIFEAKKSLNYPIDYFSMGILSAFASVTGNKIKLKVKNEWYAAPIFWFAVVSDRGSIKSHPVSTAINPIRDLDKENLKLFESYLVEYNQATDKKDLPKPTYKQIIAQDSTLEGLHKLHKHNPRGVLFFKDELIGFIQDMNKYRKGSDEQFWLESFNNKSYIVNRANSDPLLIDNICINILGTIQVDVLTDVISAHSDNGLIDRFLFSKVNTEVERLKKDEINHELIKFYNATIKSLSLHLKYYNKDDCAVLEWSEEQLDKFIEYDDKICTLQESDEVSPQLKSYLAKIKTYFPRFVLLSAIIDYAYDGIDLEIRDENLIKAEYLCDYFIASARNIFTTTVEKTEIQEVTMTLRGKTNPEKIRELSKIGLNNAQIAKKLNISRQYITKILGKM
jgi:hypothetical protein